MKDLEVIIGSPDSDNSHGVCLLCVETRACTLIRTINSTGESGVVIVKRCSGIKEDG